MNQLERDIKACRNALQYSQAHPRSPIAGMLSEPILSLPKVGDVKLWPPPLFGTPYFNRTPSSGKLAEDLKYLRYRAFILGLFNAFKRGTLHCRKLIKTDMPVPLRFRNGYGSLVETLEDQQEVLQHAVDHYWSDIALTDFERFDIKSQLMGGPEGHPDASRCVFVMQALQRVNASVTCVAPVSQEEHPHAFEVEALVGPVEMSQLHKIGKDVDCSGIFIQPTNEHVFSVSFYWK